jgi:hypothetical protein
VLWSSLAAAALVVVHSVLWDAVRWNGHTFIADGAQLVTIGSDKAGVFRLSLLCDLFGSYLLTIPATYALWQLLRTDHEAGIVDLVALGGVLYALAGALAAAVFAEAGATLIEAYAHHASAATATQFGALNDAAVATWQIPVVFTGGVWWLVSGWMLRDRWRWFARYSMALGGLGLILGALKVAGLEYDSSGPATAAFLPIAVWIGWLGLRLGTATPRPLPPG